MEIWNITALAAKARTVWAKNYDAGNWRALRRWLIIATSHRLNVRSRHRERQPRRPRRRRRRPQRLRAQVSCMRLIRSARPDVRVRAGQTQRGKSRRVIG